MLMRFAEEELRAARGAMRGNAPVIYEGICRYLP